MKYVDPVIRELLNNANAVEDAKNYLIALDERFKQRYNANRTIYHNAYKKTVNLWENGKRSWGVVEWQGLVSAINDDLDLWGGEIVDLRWNADTEDIEIKTTINETWY